MKKICFVASGGGHLMEIMKLVPATIGYDLYIVTERNEASKGPIRNFRHYYVLQQERRKLNFFFRFLCNIIISLWYLLKERPDVIISTGAGAAYPTCRLGKLLGIKIIFIESFARSKKKSKTGELMYPIADHFLVQWEDMLDFYPKASYHGSVY